ncbi:MAG: hypothetical protein A2X64_02190 [Ignavibacteria bacterium GWF2_33_9]|nr:MAG: hypothetical protein A2X64_02190 [Ignavibacteria bacterium GWF2_33_9]
MSAKKTKKTKEATWHFPLGKNNLIVIGIGILTIILGYILMSFGISEEPATVDGTWNGFVPVTLAPFVLVIGYCVIIPYGIFKNFNKASETLPENQ